MKRILTISILLLAVIFTVNADRRRMLMARNVAGSSIPTPILRLEMNEGSGVTMADSSGNGNTFTNFGATWITGKSGSGGALQFDGVNDFGRSVANITFGVKVITVCTWYWWDAYATGNDFLFEHSSNANNVDGALNFTPDTTGGLQAVIQDSVGAFKYRGESTNNVSAAAWHHLAVVFDNSTTTGDIKIYIDGTLKTQNIVAGLNDKDQSSNIATDVLYLMSRGGASLWGAGRLDDFGIWSGELDSTTIGLIKDEAR